MAPTAGCTRAQLLETIVDTLGDYDPKHPESFEPTLSLYEALVESPPGPLPDVEPKVYRQWWIQTMNGGSLVLADLLIQSVEREEVTPLLRRLVMAMDQLYALHSGRLTSAVEVES